MNEKLERIFSKAETERKAILDLVKAVPEEIFTQQHNDKWSASQIISHLILSENLSLQYMRKKYLGIRQSGRTGFWEDFKFMLLKVSQRVPLKYKAPPVLAESQPETLPYAELEFRWNESRMALQKFLHEFEESYINNKVYKHPVAGRLNVIQGVSFIREHVLHHVPQIRSRIA